MTQVLNQPRPALEISLDLQRLMLRMKGEFMDDFGQGVDYAKLKTSELFKIYLSKSRELSNADINTLNENQRKAFFINTYNALTLHGLAVSETPLASVLDVTNFWSKTSYNIGGNIYSLDDIEHGILRSNKPHPSSTTPLFLSHDPRLKFVMEELDPRIHFALVCGAKSCPAINVYSERNLDNALKAASINFLAQEVNVDINEKRVILSKILDWYGTDFGATPREVVEWIVPYISDETDLKSLLDETKQENNLEVIYSDYNWKLNKV
ncbi:uncharacterized protein [Antedon mediterranea]|uniref:uncharacterized protein n=1 Tax=Antedon mediterranea TaxID=105859 RepID=UPI003AF6929A